MHTDFAGRIRLRLSQLDINPFEAARRGGLERSFINDVLISRKKTVREDGLRRIAHALECDPEYLTGHQETPRAHASDPAQGMPVLGVCETGVWRSASALIPATVAPLLPDPRFPEVPNIALVARGDGGDAVGINDGDYVVALDYERWLTLSGPLRDGQLCVVKRERVELQETEIAVRRASVSTEGMFLDACAQRELPSVPLAGLPGERVSILGVVDRAVRIYL